MIIIPDTHGRTFWKEAVQKKKEGEIVVFLGDYLDPYRGEVDATSGEVITRISALINFREILEYKEKNPGTTKLLLGNHDTEYFLGTRASREDYARFSEIQEIYLDDLDFFDVGYYFKGPEETYTFSHTGIIKSWVERNLGEGTGIIETIDRVNQLLHSGPDGRVELREILDQIGWGRGGEYNQGSMIWADVYEVPARDWPGVYQIFGHSQQYEYPIHDYSFSMLDCRRAFRLNEETGDLAPLDKNLLNYNAYAREKT